MNVIKKIHAKEEKVVSQIALLLDINNWTISDILSLFSIIIAIIGGIFAYKQWAFANKTKRADLLGQVINILRFDKEMAFTMNLIDYHDMWYDEDFHNSNKELEYKVDKTLSYLSYVCYLIKEKQLNKNDSVILEYEISRTCTSLSVQSYLWNLYHFSAVNNAKCSFQYLIEFGIQNKFINGVEFMNSKSKKYIKILNF